jgi:hypothetical protein
MCPKKTPSEFNDREKNKRRYHKQGNVSLNRFKTRNGVH